MPSWNILPAPEWRGTPPDLKSKWLKFVRRHAQDASVRRPKELRDKIRWDQEDIAQYNRSIAAIGDSIPQKESRILEIQATIDDVVFDARHELDLITSQSSTLGIKPSSAGTVVVHVRLYGDDDIFLGDFEIDLRCQKHRYSRQIIEITQTQVGRVKATDWLPRMSDFYSGSPCYLDWSEKWNETVGVAGLLEQIIVSLRQTLRTAGDASTIDPEDPAWTGTMDRAESLVRKTYLSLAYAGLIEEQENEKCDLLELRKTQERNINNLRTLMAKNRADKIELAKLERALADSTLVDDAEALHELRLISTMSGVLGMKFLPCGTPVLMVRSGVLVDGHRYDLGDYEITLRFQPRFESQLHVTQVREPLSGSNPYWERRGYGWYFCFGSRKQAISEALTAGNFFTAVSMAVSAMDSLNTHDTPAYYDLAEVAPQKQRRSIRLRPRRQKRESEVNVA